MEPKIPIGLHRVFAAISVPASLKEQIENLPFKKLDFKNRNHPDDLHITLRFFGDLPIDQVSEIQNFLATMKVTTAFDVEAIGLSYFQTKRQMILYAPIISTRKITALSDLVTGCAGLAGLVYEPRPYVPHVTIGRLRSKNNLDDYCKRYGPRIQARWHVDQFHLLESGNHSEGKPRYKILQTYPLSPY